MAGEYDEKFDELTGLVQKMAGRVDEMRLEMRDMRTDLNENTGRLGAVESRLQSAGKQLNLVEDKVDVISAEFKFVAGMAIADNSRIDGLAKRVAVLEAEIH